jgi:hypothetical protein
LNRGRQKAPRGRRGISTDRRRPVAAFTAVYGLPQSSSDPIRVRSSRSGLRVPGQVAPRPRPTAAAPDRGRRPAVGGLAPHAGTFKLPSNSGHSLCAVLPREPPGRHCGRIVPLGRLSLLRDRDRTCRGSFDSVAALEGGEATRLRPGPARPGPARTGQARPASMPLKESGLADPARLGP